MTTVACPICAAPVVITGAALLPCPAGHVLTVTASGCLLAMHNAGGVALDMARFAAIRETYQARYPLADAGLPLGERIAADERTMRRALEERSRRQYVTS